MADITVSSGVPTRPDVTLRRRGDLPAVTARPVIVSTPGLSIAPSNDAQALVNALDIQTFSQIGNKVLKESREAAFEEGKLAQTTNQQEWADAVASGKVDPAANPWFIKGYQSQDGRVAGLDYYTQMRGAYANSPAKGSDDPAAYKQFVTDFTKSYMEKVGEGKSADWMQGFQGEMQSAQKTLAAEHAQEAERAVMAKQEANTGAEINAILNATRDPQAAATAINELGQRMKLMGMPSAAFEKVAAEAILAKAKMGDGNMLKALDGVTTGDGKGTLGSNPKVVQAKVDVSNFLTEKARGDTRWAWAVQDRQFTLQSQERARQSWEREDLRFQQQQRAWDREEQVRSLQLNIQLKAMSDPPNAYAGNKENLEKLAALDPNANQSTINFLDAFTTRREKVPEEIERPIIAQLQKDMIAAAGDKASQVRIMQEANRLFSEGKLNKDTMFRIFDDAQRIGAFDPDVARKLQDPQLARVRQAGAQVFLQAGQQSLYGSAAIDALVMEQVIDRAALDLLKTKPTATGEELARAASEALQRALPTLNPNVMGAGKAEALGGMATEAQRRMNNANTDGRTPPVPALPTADEAAKRVDPAKAQQFIQAVTEALNTGGLPAMTKTIADFDAGVGIPGLGMKLIELHGAKPSAPPKK